MLPSPISLPWSLFLLRGLPLPRKLGLLEKVYGNYLAAYGITTVSCANDHVWTLDFREVAHRWLVYGDYEGPCQMHWLRKWFAVGGFFVDSGSNICQYVVSLSPLPSVSAFVFEPVSHERDWLQKYLLRYSE